MIKPNKLRKLCVVFFAGAVPLTFSQHERPPALSAPKEYLLAEINSLSALLYELAAERYAANSSRDETWILTTHTGGTIRKYSDGRYTLLSLPIVSPEHRNAMCLCASQYNAFNLQAADRLVKAGKYKEAEELYRLILHFDRCGDEIMQEQVRKKLAYVDKLKRGEQTDLNLKRFAELCDELGTRVNFAGIATLPPTIVTNILDVRLP